MSQSGKIMNGADNQIVFVRGTGRCGSKLLAAKLDEHPELTWIGVNEVLPEELLDWSECRLGSRKGISPSLIQSSCRAFFDAYCEQLGISTGIKVQKSTGRAYHTSTLLECWPESKIIYLVRHPIPVIESLINVELNQYRGTLGFRADVQNSLLRWCNELLAFLRSGILNDDRVMLIRFKDLLRRPADTIKRVHTFIGVDPIEGQLPRMKELHEQRFRLSSQEQKWILQCTKSIRTALGYDETSYTPSQDTDPNDRYTALRLRERPQYVDGVEACKAALNKCRELGYRRVGLCGAGQLARMVCPHLDHLPVEVVGIFDEQNWMTGGRIGAFQIHPAGLEKQRGAEILIPLSMVYEEEMISRWSDCRDESVPILSLWTQHLYQ